MTEFKLTRRGLEALRGIRDKKPIWPGVRSRAGGAIGRMIDRLNDAGLITSYPYRLTDLGRAEIEKAEDRTRKVKKCPPSTS